MRPVETAGATFIGTGRAVTFDATLRRSKGLRAQVTQHEVETGAPIVDHVREQPVSLTLDCIVTTTPIGAVLGAPSATRDTDARAVIEAMFSERAPIEVWVLGEIFTDMVIESIDDQADQSTGEAWRPTIALRQIRRVARGFVDVPPLPADQRRAAAETDRGTQEPKATNADAATEAAIADAAAALPHDGSIAAEWSGIADAQRTERAEQFAGELADRFGSPF